MLQTAALLLILVLAMAAQGMASLWWMRVDDVRWTVERLTPCESDLREDLRRILVAERGERIIPDTVERVLDDIGTGQRSAAGLALQRWLWRRTLPNNVGEDALLGLYLRTWPHPEVRGMCGASRVRFGRTLNALREDEFRPLISEEELESVRP